MPPGWCFRPRASERTRWCPGEWCRSPGSCSSLPSLWKVGDAATQKFMAEFYNRRRRGEGRADALAATRATSRNHSNEQYRHG